MSAAVLRKLLRPYKAPCLLPRRKRTLWTQPYMVRPALVKATFGNGRHLLGLTALMHRPNYYLVWIDDTWETDNGGYEFLDRLDDIWNAIGDEFGFRSPEDTRQYRWPEDDSSDGCAWWDADISDILTIEQERRFRAARKPVRRRAQPTRG